MISHSNCPVVESSELVIDLSKSRSSRLQGRSHTIFGDRSESNYWPKTYPRFLNRDNNNMMNVSASVTTTSSSNSSSMMDGTSSMTPLMLRLNVLETRSDQLLAEKAKILDNMRLLQVRLAEVETEHQSVIAEMIRVKHDLVEEAKRVQERAMMKPAVDTKSTCTSPVKRRPLHKTNGIKTNNSQSSVSMDDDEEDEDDVDDYDDIDFDESFGSSRLVRRIHPQYTKESLTKAANRRYLLNKKRRREYSSLSTDEDQEPTQTSQSTQTNGTLTRNENGPLRDINGGGTPNRPTRRPSKSSSEEEKELIYKSKNFVDVKFRDLACKTLEELQSPNGSLAAKISDAIKSEKLIDWSFMPNKRHSVPSASLPLGGKRAFPSPTSVSNNPFKAFDEINRRQSKSKATNGGGGLLTTVTPSPNKNAGYLSGGSAGGSGRATPAAPIPSPRSPASSDSAASSDPIRHSTHNGSCSNVPFFRNPPKSELDTLINKLDVSRGGETDSSSHSPVKVPTCSPLSSESGDAMKRSPPKPPRQKQRPSALKFSPSEPVVPMNGHGDPDGMEEDEEPIFGSAPTRRSGRAASFSDNPAYIPPVSLRSPMGNSSAGSYASMNGSRENNLNTSCSPMSGGESPPAEIQSSQQLAQCFSISNTRNFWEKLTKESNSGSGSAKSAFVRNAFARKTR